MVMVLADTDPLAVAVTAAIISGDLATLERLLSEHRGLGLARIRNHRGTERTLLHLVTDWPGYFPAGPETARMLIGAGAELDAVMTGGRFAETALHSAASSDDAEVADVLIGAGARLTTPGGCIGTPLDNAVAFGCWQVARCLVDAGAPVERLWQAAALGLAARLEALLVTDPAPTPDQIDEAFWQACHGGQRRAAERLLAAGAHLDFIPDFADTTSVLDAARGLGTQRDNLVEWLGGLGATSAAPSEGDQPAN
jgi:hypothetical protein